MNVHDGKRHRLKCCGTIKYECNLSAGGPLGERRFGLGHYTIVKKDTLEGRPGRRLPSQAESQTIGDVVRRYRWHPEAKSLAPDGTACNRKTKGLLKRTPVIAEGQPRYIRKETDRRWEQGEDISMLDPEVVEYRPNETTRLVADPELQRDALRFGRRTLARAAGVSDGTVKAARKGERIRKSTCDKLRNAIRQLHAAVH
jgi:hypothetical protein